MPNLRDGEKEKRRIVIIADSPNLRLAVSIRHLRE